MVWGVGYDKGDVDERCLGVRKEFLCLLGFAVNKGCTVGWRWKFANITMSGEGLTDVYFIL